MSKIFEHAQDEKEREFIFNEKEKNFLDDNYVERIQRKHNVRSEDNLRTLARLEENESNFGNWMGND
jgi:hypothetical protein